MKLIVETPLGKVERIDNSDNEVTIKDVSEDIESLLSNNVQYLEITQDDGGVVIIPREILLNSLIKISP